MAMNRGILVMNRFALIKNRNKINLIDLFQFLVIFLHIEIHLFNIWATRKNLLARQDDGQQKHI